MRVILAFFSSWTNWIWLIEEDWLASWRHSTQSNNVGALRQVSIVSHSYQTYFGFPGSNLNLDCGWRDHVIMRFASVGIRARLWNKVISLYYFIFLVFLKVFQCLRQSSCSSCLHHLSKKKKGCISSCYCL